MVVAYPLPHSTILTIPPRFQPISPCRFTALPSFFLSFLFPHSSPQQFGKPHSPHPTPPTPKRPILFSRTVPPIYTPASNQSGRTHSPLRTCSSCESTWRSQDTHTDTPDPNTPRTHPTSVPCGCPVLGVYIWNHQVHPMLRGVVTKWRLKKRATYSAVASVSRFDGGLWNKNVLSWWLEIKCLVWMHSMLEHGVLWLGPGGGEGRRHRVGGRGRGGCANHSPPQGRGEAKAKCHGKGMEKWERGWGWGVVALLPPAVVRSQRGRVWGAGWVGQGGVLG